MTNSATRKTRKAKARETHENEMVFFPVFRVGFVSFVLKDIAAVTP
jgi:Na+-transporting methylmalonyl-CoA/oxaloacetate decarboxylase beta subunit